MTRQTVKIIVTWVVFPALLFGAGWYAHGWHDRSSSNMPERRARLGGFKYISPLLDVELPEGYEVNREPIPFKQKVAKFVDQQIKSGTVRNMSVYYRDLSDGPWFGINERAKYHPASMMKVPVMIAWLKRAEKDPSVLKSKLTFDEKIYTGPPQKLKPEQTLQPGHSYTIEELLLHMMQFSDNKALKLLGSVMSQEEFEYVLDNMDITSDPDYDHNSITVRTYSGFLRILYNASFLNKEMSELALQMMSSQDFPQGMAAGIPPGVKLASKFGEYWTKENPNLYQLHEFGIVYHPKGPYILGILTQGHDGEKQADIIRAVSEIVYKSVDMPNRK
jgi:beta-lactamase class A